MPYNKEGVYNTILVKYPQFKEFSTRLNSFENEDDYFYEISYLCPANKAYSLEISIDNEGVFVGFASFDVQEYFDDVAVEDVLNLIDEILSDRYIEILEFKNYEMYCLRSYNIGRCLDRSVPDQYKQFTDIIRGFNSPITRIKQQLLNSRKIIEIVSWSGRENRIITFDEEYKKAKEYGFTPEKAAFSKVMQVARTLFIVIREDSEHQKYEKPLKVIKDILSNMKHADKNIVNHLHYVYKNMDDFYGRDQIVSDLKEVIQKRTDYDISKAYMHVPAMIRGINLLLQDIVNDEVIKTKILASSMHNYPDFIIGNYSCPGPEFYKEHLCFYTREFGETVFDEWKHLFISIGG